MALNREKILENAAKYTEKRKYDKAVVELRQLTDADPNDARILHKIGELEQKQGLYAEAIDTFESVGKLYARDGFAPKAVAVYKQIRELIATHAPQLEERYGHIAPNLAELYQELRLTNEALQLLNDYAARLAAQKRETEATEIYKRIADLDPTNPIPQLRVAEALSRIKDVEGAVSSFRAAAALLVAADRRDDAIQVLERLLHHKAEPDQARTCAELYLSRQRSAQDVTLALTKLQICFQANPRDVDALTLIARCFDLLGQAQKAMGVRQEIARITQGAR